MARRMPEEGRVFIQSESELAAINMVFGASATGKRAMTSSSSPGISLMQEGLSYLAGAELPAVVINVMRGGPGLGNISPSQADYFQATRGGGHGDYRTIVLGPASVQEMADCMPLAFDLADQYRMTVMILADGVLGQMMEPVLLEPETASQAAGEGLGLDGRQRQAAEHRPFALAGRRGARSPQQQAPGQIPRDPGEGGPLRGIPHGRRGDRHGRLRHRGPNHAVGGGPGPGRKAFPSA